MIYPEFNSASIISLLISVCALAIVIVFVRAMTNRLSNTEGKLNILIKSFNTLRNDFLLNRNKPVKKEKIDYMEGDIDLVREGKKATFKAIYYPKKINRKKE